MSKSLKHIDVPGYRQKWVIGAIVRDHISRKLYRVTGSPTRYHEDALPRQRVAQVRELPAGEAETQRLSAILAMVFCGNQAPGSRAAWRTDKQGRNVDISTPLPPDTGTPARWVEKYDDSSLASFPTLTVYDKLLVALGPNYDDIPTIAWISDKKLADEARALIAAAPAPIAYAMVTVHERKVE